MRFNFHGIYILQIRIFRIFKFAIAGYSGVEIFTGEISADIWSESVYHSSIRQLQRCKTCWTRCWIRLKMSSHQMESCIWGFHIYKEIWTPFIGERLGCGREINNREDPFAVAMKRGTGTVDHVPRAISCICTLFLRQHGSISSEVTGSSRRNIDLSPFQLHMTSSIGLSYVCVHLQWCSNICGRNIRGWLLIHENREH